MQQVFEEQNEIYKVLTDQIISSNWKERRDALQRIQDNPELINIFIQNSALLLKDTNLVCIQIILQILEKILPSLNIELQEIASILVNVVLQNTKTSIKQAAQVLIKQIYLINKNATIQALGQAITSQNLKHVKQCLTILQEIGGKDVARVIVGAVQHKNSEIKLFAIDIAKQLLNDPECLQIMEKEFPEAVFQQILFQAVAGDDSMIQQTQQPQQLGKSQGVKDEVIKEQLNRELDITNIDKLPWKEKKEEIEKLIILIENGQHVGIEFSRALKYNLDNEPNSVCQNMFLRLAQVIAYNQDIWKYNKHVFSSCLNKLKEKRISQQAHQTLYTFILKQFKLGEIIDDIVSSLQSKLTDQKIETTAFIKNLFQFDLFRGQFTNEVEIQIIQSNSILQNGQQLTKLMKQLIILINESILAVRTIAQECLIQLIKLHMCSNAFITILWDIIFSQVIYQPKQQVQTIQQLILVILQQNYQNKSSNEYKRLFVIVQGIHTCLINNSITPEIYNLHVEFKFSDMVIMTLDQINGPPIQETITSDQIENLYKQEIIQQSKSPLKRINSTKSQSPQKLLSPQPHTNIQIKQKFPQQLTDIVPIVSSVDISKQLIQEVLMFQSNDKQQILQASFQIQQSIPFMLEQVRKQDLAIYLDSVIDFVINYFAEKEAQVFIDGIRLLINLIQLYQDQFHPLSLQKLFDIFQIRISEQRLSKHIQEYILSVTSVYGFQSLLIFIQQNITEPYIINELIQIFLFTLQQFGLQDYFSVGLDRNKNIFINPQMNNQCNLSIICQKLMEYPEMHSKIQIICSYFQNLQDQQLFIINLQKISQISFDSQQINKNFTSMVKFPLGSPTISKPQSALQKGKQTPNRQIQQLQVGSPKPSTQNITPKLYSQERSIEYQKSPQIQTRIDTKQIIKSPQQPKQQSPLFKQQTYSFQIKQDISEETIQFLNQTDQNLQLFLHLTNELLTGQQSNFNIQNMTENLCYLLIDIYDIDDKYLPNCFPQDSLRITSKFDNFFTLIEQICKNSVNQTHYTCIMLSKLLIVYCCFISIQSFDFSQQKFDQLLDQIFNYLNTIEQIHQSSLQIILTVVLQLSLFQQINVDPFIFNYFLQKINDQQTLIQIFNDQFMRILINNQQLIDLPNLVNLSETFLNQYITNQTILPYQFIQTAISFIQYITEYDMDNLTLSLYQKIAYFSKLAQIDQSLIQINNNQLYNTISSQIYQLTDSILLQIANLQSPDIELFITTQKQLILSARDQKILFTTPIILPFAHFVAQKITNFAKTSRTLNYRFLKYAGLILLELIELPAQLLLLDQIFLSELVTISAYFAYFFTESMLQKQPTAEPQKLKEISDYFISILIKIQTNCDPQKLFSVSIYLLERCYQVLTFQKQFDFPLQIPKFANILQTQFLIKILLQIVPSYELIYQIPRAYFRQITHLPFKNNPINQISSAPTQNDFYNQFAQRIGINTRDVKLLMRFCRTFCEQNSVNYEAFWAVLQGQIRASSGSLTGSLVGGKPRKMMEIGQFKKDWKVNFEVILKQIECEKIGENEILQEFGEEIGRVMMERIGVERQYQNAIGELEDRLRGLM